MENKDYSLMPKDYEGGQSLDSFHSTHQIAKDLAFVKKILPYHYFVSESKKRGSVHCVSKIGLRLSPYINPSTGTMVTDAEDEEMWEYVFKAIKQHFGERFQEVFHNTCFCHVDFTIYLKEPPLPKEGQLTK